MFGLRQTDAASASLILNLEGVFTALLAWFVFKENFDRRIAWGMAAIVAGGVVLSAVRPCGRMVSSDPLAIAGACLAWGIDNNLTRKVSIHDAMLIACLKGLVAGSVSVALALASGAAMPARVIVLRGRPARVRRLRPQPDAVRRRPARSRNRAHRRLLLDWRRFWALRLPWHWARRSPCRFCVAGVLMGVGVWLHLTEHHEHIHTHAPMKHEHPHVHDEHHRHRHAPGEDAGEPHSHEHVHEPIRHAHAHYPDVHHRHEH